MSKLSKWLKKQGKSIEKHVSNVIPHQHSADRRAATEAVAEQISYYQTAKEDIVTQAAAVKEERATEKKKIEKKQIKSARRSYRAPGFMETEVVGYSETLG